MSTSNNKKMIDKDILASLTKDSEVKEDVQDESNKVVVRKKRKKTYKGFSLSLELENYNQFMQYLNDNDISSGSEIIRGLMRKEGIIK